MATMKFNLDLQSPYDLEDCYIDDSGAIEEKEEDSEK